LRSLLLYVATLVWIPHESWDYITDIQLYSN
jgi:hypothetical protein